MNDAGLAVSLTYGGRSVYGRGFAILIVVRYLLETCDTTARYRPVEGRVTYYWPGESWQRSFGDFAPGSRTVTLGRAS